MSFSVCERYDFARIEPDFSVGHSYFVNQSFFNVSPQSCNVDPNNLGRLSRCDLILFSWGWCPVEQDIHDLFSFGFGDCSICLQENDVF